MVTDPNGDEHALDLGDGHWLNWIAPGPDGPRIGAIIFHRLPPGAPDFLGNGMCAASVWFDAARAPAGRPVWALTGAADEHITLSPSLLCSCGDHGFVRDGKWVRA